MQAKLFKFPDGDWVVEIHEDTKGIRGSMMQHFASTFEHGYKLSLKNCQAIERGYDLDEFAEKEFPYDFDCPIFETLGITEKSHKSILIGMLQGTLQKGFQKALEFMGDKKYSEEDVRRVCSLIFLALGDEGDITTDEAIKSIQQTEWDVDIEMRFHGTRHKKGEWIPRLDEDGCLILKRV